MKSCGDQQNPKGITSEVELDRQNTKATWRVERPNPTWRRTVVNETGATEKQRNSFLRRWINLTIKKIV